MVQNRFIVMVLVCIVLGGCASTVESEHVFSLTLSRPSDAVTEGSSTDKPVLVVGPLQLARYIDTPGIAMQINGNEIRTSSSNYWAEPLSDSITKVLVRELGEDIPTLRVENDVSRWAQKHRCRLRAEFDEFFANDQSQVVVGGRYWIHGFDNTVLGKQEFRIVRALKENGYSHAVLQLRGSLSELADAMSHRIKSNSYCNKPAG